MLVVGQRLRLNGFPGPATEEPRHFAGAVRPENFVGLGMRIAGGPRCEGGLPVRRGWICITVAASRGAGREADGARFGCGKDGEANWRGNLGRRGGNLAVERSPGGPWERGRADF